MASPPIPGVCAMFEFKWVVALAVVLMTAGCGGTDGPGKEAMAFAGRMHAASVTATAASDAGAVTQGMTLDWAEYAFPDLFPKALAQHFPDIEYQGGNYYARAYVGPWGTRYLGITSDGRIYGLGDFTNDSLQQFDDIAFWSARILGDQCKVDPGSCATVSLAAGGEVTLNEGVRLLVLEGSGKGEMAVHARVVGGEPGRDVGESRLASYHYSITSGDFERGELTAPMRLSIPVSPSADALVADPTEFDIQVYNPETKEWDWVDAWAIYEPATKTVSFWINHFSEYRAIENVPSNRDRYTRWIVHYDNFEIIYYKPKDDASGVELPYAPPSDATWIAVGGNTDQYTNIPNYVEDLNQTLSTSLAYYLSAVKTSTGTSLFTKPASKPYVRVNHLPPSVSGGDSKWGMMRIATSNDNYTELAKVAAHELFHVLSDQHYTVFGAAYNRWFFEAAANLWTTRALGMTRAEQVAYFRREMSGYLTVSLDASDEGSYSAAGDFLEWLESKTGKPIVTDVIAADYFNDLAGLDAVVGATGTTLSEYYTQYVLEASVGNHDLAVPLVERLQVLTAGKAGVREKTALRHLSAIGKGLATEVAADGLLVVSSYRSTSTPTLLMGPLKTFSYISDKPSGFDTAHPLEPNFQTGKPITVKHFGRAGTPAVNNSRLFQLIVNSELTDPAPLLLEYEFDAYLLVPPVVSIDSGRVNFTYGVTYAPGQAPIAGFNVYLDGRKINPTLLAATERVHFDTNIQPGSNVIVTVVDKYANEWPELPKASVSMYCSIDIYVNQLFHHHRLDYDDLRSNSPVSFNPPSATWGRLSGSLYNVEWLGGPYSNISGSIRFELSTDQLRIESFAGEARYLHASSGDSGQWAVSGAALPARLEPRGALGPSRAIAEIAGAAACGAISSLERRDYLGNGALEWELKSFSCDAGSLVRIVCEWW